MDQGTTAGGGSHKGTLDRGDRALDRRQRAQGPPVGVDDRRRTTVSGRRATDALKMACPYCGASESAVVRSRGAIVADQVGRRRECADCGERWPTYERVDREALARELAADSHRRRN